MIRIFIEITAGILMILFAFKTGNRSVIHGDTAELIQDPDVHQLSKNPIRYRIAIAVIFLVFTFLLFYRVNEIPVPFNNDEAGSAYDALSIIRYGVDRYLYKNPVVFQNFGGHGENALLTYLMVLCFKIFGYSYLSVRLPTILLSLFSALCFTALIRKIYGEKAALVAMILFCILPFSVMHSRWALESFLFFPMTIFSCTCLFAAVNDPESLIKWVGAGVLFGLTLYTYAVSYVQIFIFLVIYLLALLWMRQIRWKNIITMGIPMFFFALPLMLMLLVNYGFIDEIKTPFLSVPKIIAFKGGDMNIKNIPVNLQLSTYNFLYRLIIDDLLPYNSFKKSGILYFFSIPLIFTGMINSARSAIRSIHEKSISLDFLMLILFLSALFTTLILNEVNVNRACEIYVPLIYYLLIGILFLIRGSKVLHGSVFAIYAVLFAFFLNYYFVSFPEIIQKHWGSFPDLKDALYFTESINKENRDVYVIGYNGNYLYTLLALEIDPYSFNESIRYDETMEVTGFDGYRFLTYTDWDNFPDDNIYIFRNFWHLPWQVDLVESLAKKQFGSVWVYYPRE